MSELLRTHRIARKPLYAEVVEGLREMIIGGKLQAGSRLIENELCDLFGISRTPFREALKVLESEGLVVLKPNRGASVSVMTEREIAELFEVVANLERAAVELAVDRLDTKGLKKLRKLHDRMIRLYQDKKRRECFQVDYETHQQIVMSTGNSLLVATHASLMPRTRRARYLALSLQSRWDESMEEHETFMVAIEKGESRRAGELMHTHVSQTGLVVRDAFISSTQAPTRRSPADGAKRR